MERPGPPLPALTLLLAAGPSLPALASTLAPSDGFGIFAAEGTIRGGWILALVAIGCAGVGLAAAAILNGRVRRSDTGGEKLQAAARQPAAGEVAPAALRQPLFFMLVLVATAMVAHRAAVSTHGFRDPWAWGLGGAALLGAGLSVLAVRGSVACAAVGLRLAAAAPLGTERLQLTARRAVTAGALIPDALGLAACALVVIVWGPRAWEGLLAYALGRTAAALLLPAPLDPRDDTRITTDLLTSGDLVFLATAVLGVAWLGPAGLIFPLCIRAAGILSFALASAAPAVAPLIAAAAILAAAPLCLRFTPDQVPAQAWQALTTLGPWATLGSVEKSASGAVVSLLDFRPAWAGVLGLAFAPALAWLARWAAGAGARTGLPRFVLCCAPPALAFGAASGLAAGAGPLGVAATAAFLCLGLLALNGPALALAQASPLARRAAGIAAAGYDGHVMGAATLRTSSESLVALETSAAASLGAARGIAAGVATAAALLLVAATTALLASGGTARPHLPRPLFDAVAGLLTLSNPRFLAGLLLGAAAPLFWHRLVAGASARAAALLPPAHPAAGTSAPVPGLSFADLAAPACFVLSLPVLAGFAFGSAALAGLVCGFVAPGQFLPALFPPRDRSAPPPHAPHPALQAAALAALAAAPLLAGYDAQLLDVLRPAFRHLDIRIPAGCRLRPFDAVWTTAIAVSLLGVIVAALRLRPAAVSRRKS